MAKDLAILEHSNSGIMEGEFELQLDSPYLEASDRALITVLGDSVEMEEGSGARNIHVNTHHVDQDVQGYLNEKKRALNKSRSGYVGNLTRISNEITHLMEHGGTQEEISKEMENLNDAWIKFVDAHDKYCKCLDSSVDTLALEKAEQACKEQMERKLNLDSAVKSWRPTYQHNSVFSSLRPKGPGSDVSKPSSKSSTRTMSRKREALALAQLKIRQLKARQRLDEEEREIRKKRELLEAEIEAEKAEVSLRIYEGEIGEERRDIELVVSHDEEYWHPPKSQGVADPRGTSEPLTVDDTSPLKPEVPAIPSLSTINYLNETVSGSFTPHSKQDTLVVPTSLHNSVQPNGCATLQPVSRPSSDRQLRFMPSLDNPTFGTAGAVTSSVTPTSTTVTSSFVSCTRSTAL